jgi:hypothetical protein
MPTFTTVSCGSGVSVEAQTGPFCNEVVCGVGAWPQAVIKNIDVRDINVKEMLN